MPASIFSETELARLASFPEEIPGDDLIRAFTLTGADRDLVAIRRGAAHRLGVALQLCALRYLGFVPRNLSAAPRSAACFVADQLEVSPDEIQSYARSEQTRRQHFTEVRRRTRPRSRNISASEGASLSTPGPRTSTRSTGRRSSRLRFVTRPMSSTRSSSTRRTPLATPRSSSPCFIFWGCSSPRASGTWALSACIVSMLLRKKKGSRFC